LSQKEKIKLFDITHGKSELIFSYFSEHVPRIGDLWFLQRDKYSRRWRVEDVHWVWNDNLKDYEEVQIFIKEVS